MENEEVKSDSENRISLEILECNQSLLFALDGSFVFV